MGLAAATLLTEGASALQNGHHGVQNHSTAGLPCSDEPLNGAPLSVVPVKSRRSSARAVGGPLTVSVKTHGHGDGNDLARRNKTTDHDGSSLRPDTPDIAMG